MANNRSERALNLRNEVRAGVFAKFLDIMIEVYGKPDLHSLERLIKEKNDGAEVEIYFTALDKSISIYLSRSKLVARNGNSYNPVTKVIFDVPKEQLIPILVELAHTKDNLMGLGKFVLKYYLRRKVKVKGSLFTGITLLRLMFLGKHPLFENI
ncbi:MAG: hypothetical protein EU544_01590 [Promethearchaeota archaeon]|nr:MAG: hypothetical protein EU544_01590 [Candidatus Lokiarchaeota archaeon]